MSSTAFSKSLEELDRLIYNNSTSPQEIAAKVSEVIQKWKVFQEEYGRMVVELEQFRKETQKNNQIFQLKLLTTPPPYNPESLYERRQFLKKKTTESSELEILQERNRRLTLLETTLSRSSASSLSPSPPSSGYGSPSHTPGFLTPSSANMTPRLRDASELGIIRQMGSQTKLSPFQSFSNNCTLLSISTVELSHLEIDPDLMFDSLRRHAHTLTVVKLDKVLFKGELNQRIEMPNLQEFYCYQVTNWLHKCENNNVSRETFKSLLFFGGDWDVCELLVMPLRRIELVVDGWTQFKLNHESGELVSKLAFTSDILAKLGSRESSFQLKKLGLQATRLDLSAHEKFPSTVTYLNFQSILTSNLTIVEILRACPELRELRFKNYIDTNGIYLKDIPSQHLKFLCLGLCTYTLAIKYSPGVIFPVLETLIFPTNIMDPKILQNLSTIFTCKKAIVYLCLSVTCNKHKTGHFVLNQLLQIQGIQEIRLVNLRRVWTPDVDRDLYEAMEEFLISAGLTNMASTSVLLEKKTTALGKVKWLGRDVACAEEHQVLEFQLRDGHKFSCWESYLKRY